MNKNELDQAIGSKLSLSPEELNSYHETMRLLHKYAPILIYISTRHIFDKMLTCDKKAFFSYPFLIQSSFIRNIFEKIVSEIENKIQDIEKKLSEIKGSTDINKEAITGYSLKYTDLKRQKKEFEKKLKDMQKYEYSYPLHRILPTFEEREEIGKVIKELINHVNSLSKDKIQKVYLKFRDDDVLHAIKEADRALKIHEFFTDTGLYCMEVMMFTSICFIFYKSYHCAINGQYNISNVILETFGVMFASILITVALGQLCGCVSRTYLDSRSEILEEKVNNIANELEADYKKHPKSYNGENPSGRLKEPEVQNTTNEQAVL